MSLPKHLMENEHALWALRKFANTMRGRYGVPVYLCGSALREDNPNPRDWDVRIELSDDDFASRYGPVALWADQGITGDWTEVRWRWSDDCIKQVKWARRCCPGLNIDFQIYPESHCRERYADRPKVQLDTRNDGEEAPGR